jgi:serine/threonine-protein kinase
MSNEPPAPPQQSAIGEIDGYHFDVSDLLGDEAADTVAAQPNEGQTAEPSRLEMTGDMSEAFGSSSTPGKIPVQEATPVQEPPKAPPRIGFLKIEARPSAEVYIDGVYKGDTPPAMSLRLRAGEHKVECRHPRYEDYREVLRIVNGELSRRIITLKKLRGTLNVVTLEGAEVYVDGKLVGVTPIRKPIDLDSGPHMVTLKKTGYHTWSSEVMVEPQKTLPLKITLSPRY